MKKFKNQTDLVFVDISCEEWREYTFPDGSVVLIKKPLYIAITNNGHRILDESGVCHYIPMRWIHLKWKPKKDAPHFVL